MLTKKRRKLPPKNAHKCKKKTNSNKPTLKIYLMIYMSRRSDTYLPDPRNAGSRGENLKVQTREVFGKVKNLMLIRLKNISLIMPIFFFRRVEVP